MYVYKYSHVQSFYQVSGLFGQSLASYPGPVQEEEKRAWYLLHVCAHAHNFPNFLGKLDTPRIYLCYVMSLSSAVCTCYILHTEVIEFFWLDTILRSISHNSGDVHVRRE